MPITQQRMEHLIVAAETALQLFENLEAAIEYHGSQAKAGRETWQEALAALALLSYGAPTRNARMIISEERLRYNFTHARNESVKRRKANLRDGQRATLQQIGYINDQKQRLLRSRNTSDVGHQAILHDRELARIAALADEESLDLAGQQLDLDDEMPVPLAGLSPVEQARLDEEVARALEQIEREGD